MGGNGDIDLSTIPLMTQAQEGALAELLPAVMGMMSGFPLGEAYQPGAYNVKAFPEFSMEHIRKKNGDGDGGGDRDKITKEQLTDPNKSKDKITKKQLTAPDGGGGGGDGKKKIISNGTVRPKTMEDEAVLDMILPPQMPPPGTSGQITTPGTIGGMPGTAPEMLAQQPPTSIPSMPGGKGGSPATIPETQPISPIQQALTQPIVQPFREGMTGNYPRRRI